LLTIWGVSRLDSKPGPTPTIRMTAYGDRIESLTIPAVVVGGVTPRLVLRAAPTGGVFVRIELPDADGE
jgi:hypothetical protein